MGRHSWVGVALLAAVVAVAAIAALISPGAHPASLLDNSEGPASLLDNSEGSGAGTFNGAGTIMNLLRSDSSVLSRYAAPSAPAAPARRQGVLKMTRYGVEPASWCAPDSPSCHDMAGVKDLGLAGQPTHDGLLSLAAKFPDLYKEAVERNGGDFKLAGKIAAEEDAKLAVKLAGAASPSHAPRLAALPHLSALRAVAHAAAAHAAPAARKVPQDAAVLQLAKTAVVRAVHRTAEAKRRMEDATQEAQSKANPGV
ncbi:hypothetical protein T484DRAFT_1831592 [Baffinella frigidus]|nr:hypothetical protein T484DRAFT_1831592 [Cryptophyta sp. CCMP2293]